MLFIEKMLCITITITIAITITVTITQHLFVIK